jgi:hypothetical protein
MFNLEFEIILKINISNFVINIYLSQKYERKLKLIIYYFRKISSAELNYNIYDKELLVIVVVFK